ncbi:MAG: riboflavin synthase [Lentisphaeria bacterium]
MFTGIIEAVGEVVASETRGGDVRLTIYSSSLDWSDVALGDSIASNGVCLTAVEFAKHSFIADVSVETLNFTTIGHWKRGQKVNLEKALTPQSRLGGHIVSGHVDGIGEVVSRVKDARSERFQIKLPKTLTKYVAHKGSITVDGTSLTVNAVNGDVFDLNIVPHTIANTSIGSYRLGTKVNLEVDVIARYLERLLLGDKAAESSSSQDLTASALNAAFLAENGY